MRNVYRLILSALLLLASGLASAQIKVSALPNGTTPVSGDYAICDQSGVTNKCTYSQVATSVSNSLGLGTWATQNFPTFVTGYCLSNNGSSWQWITCTSGGSPGGSNGQIQYNNAGNFGGLTTSGTGSVVLATGATMTLTNASGLSLTTGVTGQLPFVNMNLTSANIISLWSGTCNSSTYLRGDGSCSGPSGSGTVVAAPQGNVGCYTSSGTVATVSGCTPVATQGILNNIAPVTSASTSYTFSAADKNLPFPGTIFSASSTVTATIPNDSTGGWVAGDEIAPQQGGSGIINVTAGSGTILCSTWSLELTSGSACSGSGGLAAYPTYNQYEGQVWRHTTVANTWQLVYQTPYGTQQVFNIGTGTTALPTSALASGSCTTTTVASYYATANSKVTLTFGANPRTVTGYFPASSGAGNLTVSPWFTNATQPGQLNITVCNDTASSITPAAMNMNYVIFP